MKKNINENNKKHLILVTNDDGVDAPGRLALHQAMEKIGAPVTIAPSRNSSASSHSLTMHRPLRVLKISETTHSVNGTPVDCVTLGISKILRERPVLVVSGINSGANLGDDINYSGTVSAAVEGTMLGVPSMAVSLAGEPPYHFETAAHISQALALLILSRGLPRDTLLNINIPNCPVAEIKGIRFTCQGRRQYDDAIKETFDPWGRKHYWIGGGTPTWDNGVDSDSRILEQGMVSITPLHLDLTNYTALDLLRKTWPEIRITDPRDRAE